MNKILVADDDNDILDIVSLILKMQGFEVISLLDCRQVIKTAEEVKPDLILLDINLGFCDGRKLCLELKNVHLFGNHILLFSANPELATSLNHYKADGFIRKPFDVKGFVNTIRAHMPIA